MKTIDEWVSEFDHDDVDSLKELISAVRREAFERCEQEARRLREAYGWEVADTIREVYREEGEE